MRKVSFLLFLTAACTAFAAGEFRVEKKGENAVILDNTTVGCDKHKMPVMPLIDSGTVIKKVFILENAPAAFRKPVKASISIFWNCKDQSAAVRKIAKNGFNEQFRLVVNGHEMILPTSDDRLPKNKMQWTEISFPVEWLKPGVNNITLSKIHGPGKDDFIYVGVDTATEPLFSRISLDGGKNFAQYSRHFSSLKGEFLIKLILYQTISEVTVNFDDSSEVKTTGSAKVDGGFLNIDGTLGYATIPGSEKFNVTPKGLTIAGFVRQLPPAPGSSKKDNNMMLAFKDKAWFIGRTGNSFNLSFCTNGRAWNNAAFGGE